MNPNSNSTSSTLIRSVQRYEQEGWNKLARLYGPLVYRWTKKVGFSAEDVADIGQEVFRVVAIKINEFDLARDSGGFRAWLRQITRNKIGDRLRKLANEEQAIGGSDNFIKNLVTSDWMSKYDEDSSQDDNSELFAAMLRMMRENFEDATWQAFLATAIENKPASVVSSELQMTAKAVRQAKYRVLKKLREEFGELLD